MDNVSTRASEGSEGTMVVTRSQIVLGGGVFLVLAFLLAYAAFKLGTRRQLKPDPIVDAPASTPATPEQSPARIKNLQGTQVLPTIQPCH